MTPALGPLYIGIGIVLIGLACSTLYHRHNGMSRLRREQGGRYYRGAEAGRLRRGVDPDGNRIGGRASHRVIRAVEFRDADGAPALAASLRHVWGRRRHVTQVLTQVRATMWVAPRTRRRSRLVDPVAVERARASSVPTGDVEFDARFEVYAPPFARVTALLTADVRRALIDDPRAERFPFLLRDGCLVTWGSRGMSKRRLAEELAFLKAVDARLVASCDGEPDTAFLYKLVPGWYPRQPESDDDNVYGPGFHAYRRNGSCWLSWDGGGIVGKVVEGEITEEEFHRLRHDPEAFHAIARRVDPQR